VPRRFDSLKEARASGLPIIARSEHQQDYDGISGLLWSPRGKRLFKLASETELKSLVLGDEGQSRDTSTYCNLTGTDQDKFVSDVSFSFWEFLGGCSRTITADSAIKELYHITSFEKNSILNYTLYHNDTHVSFVRPLPSYLQRGLEGLVAFYEQIRNLPRFDSNHCPIIEVQTVNRLNYFLQYHRTRDFQPSEFYLDRALNKNEFEALFVRGATPPDGIVCKTTLMYGDFAKDVPYTDWILPNEEEASFDFHFGYIFSELMYRERKLQVIHGDSLNHFLFMVLDKHVERSMLFKPAVSLCVGRGQLFSEKEKSEMSEKAYETGENQYLNLHVVSDGRRALVERV